VKAAEAIGYTRVKMNDRWSRASGRVVKEGKALTAYILQELQRHFADITSDSID